MFRRRLSAVPGSRPTKENTSGKGGGRGEGNAAPLRSVNKLRLARGECFEYSANGMFTLA